ncbi:hypothetical protein B296_00044745 [Ensete ventricosum]|uniref:Uncharacterized protein n=1 Tax=Ensete ventricosum TaxID=4639 RepID=A0A426Z9U9_ENSVE|nr:hypothetical protein B296_00044745 [Ensete ventricosum]
MRPHAARLGFWFARRSLGSKLLDESTTAAAVEISPLLCRFLCWFSDSSVEFRSLFMSCCSWTARRPGLLPGLAARLGVS